MLFGIFFILCAWLIPDLPLWFSIILTIYGSIKIIARIIMLVDAASERS